MITLSSDFGSPYPAAMKGIILQRTDARLVDIAHDFPRQDVRAGAFWLREVLPYFPSAVHLVVIDPGVGTDRAAIVVTAGDHALVGPDNGVLLPVARRLAGLDTDSGEATGDGDIAIYRVAEQDPETATGDWPPAVASSTFHGRDVFAPAAARVHELGIDGFAGTTGFEPVDEYTDLTFPEPALDEEGATGEVIVVDGFGNVITNIPGGHLSGQFGRAIEVGGTRVPARKTYATVEPGGRLVTVGSHGNVELAVNQGRGDEAFGLGVGDEVRLSW